MLQNNISNKCCSFELLLNVDGFHQYIKQQFLKAPNQHLRMIFLRIM